MAFLYWRALQKIIILTFKIRRVVWSFYINFSFDVTGSWMNENGVVLKCSEHGPSRRYILSQELKTELLCHTGFTRVHLRSSGSHDQVAIKLLLRYLIYPTASTPTPYIMESKNSNSWFGIIWNVSIKSYFYLFREYNLIKY